MAKPKRHRNVEPARMSFPRPVPRTEMRTALARTDWGLFARQKAWLARQAQTSAEAAGLLDFLDAVQDAAVADYGLPEACVFVSTVPDDLRDLARDEEAWALLFSEGQDEWTLTRDGVLWLQVYDEDGRLHSGIKATVVEEQPFPEDRDPVYREPDLR
jgi:hypothetical protein